MKILWIRHLGRHALPLRIRAVLDLKHPLPWKLGTWSLDVYKYTSKERKKKEVLKLKR
jgi:hypothetical protein